MIVRRLAIVVALALLGALPADARKIEVGGHKIHVKVQGDGAPTVVFDAGLGHCFATWDEVSPAIRRETRVLLYDRAGLGRSAPCDRPRTSDRMVRELRELLERADVEPPFILVGHSLGGLNVRLFASRHPDDVAGLVLIDPTPEDYPSRDQSLRAPESRLRLETRHALAPPAVRRELRAAPESAEQVRMAAPLPRDLPITLISSPRTRDTESFRRAWTTMQHGLAARLGARHLVVEDAGHYIQYDRPDVVIAAVRDMIELVRRDGAVETARTGF